MAQDDFRGRWSPRSGGFEREQDAREREGGGYSRTRGYGRERVAGEREMDEYGGPGYGDRGEYEPDVYQRAYGDRGGFRPDASRRAYGDRGGFRGAPGDDDWGERSANAAAEREWGAGYAGGYGRSGGYGERGGRGAWGGPSSSATTGEPDHTGYGGFGYSTGYGTDLGTRPNHTGRGPRNYQRSDERITEDVNEALTDDPDLDASDIEVRVAQGEVTLTGSVPSRGAKRLAEDLAEGATGVRDVRNQLTVNRAAQRG
ncbi:MAG TPA: BON domain-containing protein [Gemmatimonadaceae bacterium]|nr:BON domain-containing protein [Gemmatimonadaceae bacterium]